MRYCKSCTAAYAPAPKCPQCGSTEYTDRHPDEQLVGDAAAEPKAKPAETGDGEQKRTRSK
jgi:hypothetical protein